MNYISSVISSIAVYSGKVLSLNLQHRSIRALFIVGIVASLILIFLIVSLFVGKKKIRNVTVVKTEDTQKIYATGAIRRDGSNLSMVNTVTNVVFKKDTGEEFTLQVSEEKARGLQEGVKGTVVFRNGKLLRFLVE